MTDALGRRTNYTYDTMGNRTSITRLAGTSEAVTTSYTYESAFNQLASATDPLGHTTTYTYDSKGNLSSVTNPLNEQTFFTYNPAGQPLSLTDPLNQTMQLTYNFGDLATFADPLGNTTAMSTDIAGRAVSVTNPLGQQFRSTYDALDRVTQTTDSINGVTAFVYDPNGNRTSVTDAAGGITMYGYDEKNRATTRRDPLQRAASFQYNGGNNMVQFTDWKGQISTVSYDSLNRPQQVTYADGATKMYTYDAGNRLTQIVDSTAGAITRAYDGQNQLLSETTPQGTVNYTYDAAGRRTSMTVAGQPTVNYTYDGDDRLIQITQGTATATFAYDAAGRRTSLTLPNGVVVSYSYDAASRLTGLTYTKGTTVLGDLTYTYNKIGQRIAVGGSFAHTGLPQALNTGTYDAADQQLTLGDKSATFDANGNLVTLIDPSGTTTYTWNARNQLVALTGPSVTASFQYDAFGRRVRKTVNGVTTDVLYDRFNPVQELSGGAPFAALLSSLSVDEVLTRTDAAGLRAFLDDGLGSTLALTDSAGALISEYTYEPFGKTTVNGAASANAFQYTGRENDGTGLYYYRARYYHPGLQRFVSQDPIEFDGGDTNLYGYVFNDPINFRDPFGLEQVFTGYATWYNLPGNLTTSGVPFDPTQLTGAMTKEKIPLGQDVTVEYEDQKSGTKKTICVEINDRGPFKRGPDGKPIKPYQPDPENIIDLTPRAFEDLVGNKALGRVPVTVRVP